MIGNPTSTPTTVYLARHGESVLNQARRVSGRLDTPLSLNGHRFSEDLAELLCDIPLTGIYTSALMRTIDTARPTAKRHGLSIQINDSLNELHFGVLEGRYRDARDPEALAIWEARKRDKRSYQIPGGERFVDMADRVRHALNHILTHEAVGMILIVGHRNVNQVLFGILMQQPEEQWPRLALKSQSVYRINTGSSHQLTTLTLSGKRTGMLSSETVLSEPQLRT
ncbi:MAG: histidine phosphatase family protein [Nitrospira sp.]